MENSKLLLIKSSHNSNEINILTKFIDKFQKNLK